MISLRWNSPGKGLSFKDLLEVAQKLEENNQPPNVYNYTGPTDPKLMISEGIYATEGIVYKVEGY